ncbi:nuclear transport factor 2 family protein [Caulobacter segnis]
MTIEQLLVRNLHEVFGEGDPARRRAAIDALYNEDAVFYGPGGESSPRPRRDRPHRRDYPVGPPDLPLHRDLAGPGQPRRRPAVVGLGPARRTAPLCGPRLHPGPRRSDRGDLCVPGWGGQVGGPTSLHSRFRGDERIIQLSTRRRPRSPRPHRLPRRPWRFRGCR